jgi:hypothetical protein
VGTGKKNPSGQWQEGLNQIISYYFTAFFALSLMAPILAFAVSATALTVESTFEAVESTAFFALSATVETAESVLAAASLLPPPQDVKAAAMTRTVSNFFIEVILVAGKCTCLSLKKQAPGHFSRVYFLRK